MNLVAVNLEKRKYKTHLFPTTTKRVVVVVVVLIWYTEKQ